MQLMVGAVGFEPTTSCSQVNKADEQNKTITN